MPALATSYYWVPDIVGKVEGLSFSLVSFLCDPLMYCVCVQCGIEVLLHDKDGYTEVLQLYKQLLLHTHKLVCVMGKFA